MKYAGTHVGWRAALRRVSSQALAKGKVIGIIAALWVDDHAVARATKGAPEVIEGQPVRTAAVENYTD